MKTKEELNLWWIDYRKKRYKMWLDKGICPNCQKRPPKTGSVCCEVCLLNKKISTNFRGSKNELLKKYKEFIDKQKGMCAICRLEMKKIVIDHKHGTEDIRGLLCNSCNVAIGLLKEDINILKRCIKYLK